MLWAGGWRRWPENGRRRWSGNGRKAAGGRGRQFPLSLGVGTQEDKVGIFLKGILLDVWGAKHLLEVANVGVRSGRTLVAFRWGAVEKVPDEDRVVVGGGDYLKLVKLKPEYTTRVFY